VYNHLNDKATLFRHAIEAAADAVATECLDAVQRLREPGDNVRAATTNVAYQLLKVCSSQRARALRTLTYAQARYFPDLIDTVHDRTSKQLADALADRLARWTLAGWIRPCDPALAAEQLLALLTGPMEHRSGAGTRKVPRADIRRIADAAVDTFFRAYSNNDEIHRMINNTSDPLSLSGVPDQIEADSG
jgi:AcrR family transcriptional regulator